MTAQKSSVVYNKTYQFKEELQRILLVGIILYLFMPK